jgi:hypothetical protein
MKNFYHSYKSLLLEEIENQMKTAVVPGSFKPPHKGHYTMIKHYSEMVGPEGQVIVVISKPSAKAQRTTSTGKVISPEVVEKIMRIYCQNLPNVDVTIAQSSPVKFCYDIGEQVPNGILIFGCSKKDDDIKRFNTIKKYVEEKNPGIIVIDPVTTAVDVTEGAEGVVSASDFRRVFGDANKMAEFLPDHLNDGQKRQVIQMLLN